MILTKLRHAVGVIFVVSSLLLIAIVHWPNRHKIRIIEFPRNIAIDQDINSKSRGSIWMNIPSDIWLRQTHSLNLKLVFRDDPAYPMIQSRLDLPGAWFLPNGIISQRVVPREPVNLSWKIKTLHSDEIEGTIWVYQAEPANGNQQSPKTELLAVIPFHLVTKTILGLGWKDIQVISWALFTIGLAMIYEFFLLWIKKYRN